jgi:hypothetical protein
LQRDFEKEKIGMTEKTRLGAGGLDWIGGGTKKPAANKEGKSAPKKASRKKPAEEKEKPFPYNIMMPGEMHAQFKAEAARQRKPMNRLILAILEKSLK